MAEKFAGMDLTKSIFIGLVLILYFLFINNPFSEVKEMATANLMLIGSLGFLVFGLGTQTFYPVRGRKDLINDLAVGAITGIVGIFLIGVLLAGAQGVFNLTGTITPAAIGAATSGDQVLFISIVYPLTETIILIGGGLFLYNALKNVKGLPYPKIVAMLAIVMLFAALHFNGLSQGQFEYSLSGFINFIGNTQDISVSAFPQMLMGIYWIFLGFAYRSWIVPAAAHILNNVYAVYLILGFDPVLALIVLFFAGVVAITWKKNGLSELRTFSFKEAVN